MLEIGPRWGAVAAMHALANVLEGRDADQRLVLSEAQCESPFRQLDIPGVKRLIQKLNDALRAHQAVAVLREERMRLQEAHHISEKFDPVEAATAFESNCRAAIQGALKTSQR